MKRLRTKADRLAVQASEFESMIKRGYIREDYKELIIWTHDILDGRGIMAYYVRLFKATTAHHLDYRAFRSAGSRDETIANYKANHERNLAYKEKAKTDPRISGAAGCAKAIREELKGKFAGVKFSVTSETFSGGDSVRVSWLDGPTEDQVQEITGKYQEGHFNGMEDIYEYSNRRTDIPQSKYVFEKRAMSEGTKATIEQEQTKIFTDEQLRGNENIIYRIWQKSPLPVGAIVTGFDRTSKDSGNWEDLYRIGYEEGQTKSPSLIAPGITPGTVQIIDYSEKAIAVIGDTKPLASLLSGIGGKFNGHLKCGPGWIFSKKRLEQVTAAIRDSAKRRNDLFADIQKEIKAIENIGKTEPTPEAQGKELPAVMYANTREGAEQAAHMMQIANRGKYPMTMPSAEQSQANAIDDVLNEAYNYVG